MDGDGDLDAVTADEFVNINLWTNDGTCFFSGPTPLTTAGQRYRAAALGDVDWDGDLDVMVAVDFGTDRVLFMDGTGGVDAEGPLPSPVYRSFYATLDDFDGDGDLDLTATATSGVGVSGQGVFLNDGTGSFSDSGQLLGYATGSQRRYVPVAVDVDGDGDEDLIASMHQSDKRSEVFINDGNAAFTQDTSLSLSAVNTIKIGAADFDADGDVDLLEGTWNGGGGGAPNVVYINGVTCPAGGPADTDGDGVADPDDNCPNDANPGQEDLDGDDLGDVCDPDADGDGDPGATDCDDLDPARYAGAVELCDDGIDNNCNGLVDLDDTGGDCDGDGVPNGSDNCEFDLNPGQDDLDGDGDGDICDLDDDDDGVDDLLDNCPAVANAGQDDYDGDGAGDACDADSDADGVDDTIDLCHFSAPSDLDAGVPSRGLGKNRWADIDGDGVFDTSGNNPTGRYFDMTDTVGCGCAQIIAVCGYGNGHTKFGCSNGVMDAWTGLYDEAGGAVGSCN